MNICEICGIRESIGVASSRLGPMSMAMCRECVEHAAEPEWMVRYMAEEASWNVEWFAEGSIDCIKLPEGKGYITMRELIYRRTLPVLAYTRPAWWSLHNRYAHPDSYFEADRWDEGTRSVIHTYSVTVEGWGPSHLLETRLLDIWEPRVEHEVDGDEDGMWDCWFGVYDKVTYAGTGIELNEDERELFHDAIAELIMQGES